ncbi:DUF6624 domain-containing protein [Deinococcus altitudinis]|uniref:DUF6624 domain-containing protein n=1 Tax=Deinococcus altitudinis TaxID=468914 RepID=UPI003891CC32
MNPSIQVIAGHTSRRWLVPLLLAWGSAAQAQPTPDALPTPIACSALISADTVPLPAPLQTAIKGTLTAYQTEIQRFNSAHSGGNLTDAELKESQHQQTTLSVYLRRLLKTSGWITGERGGSELALALGALVRQSEDVDLQWCAGALALKSDNVAERGQGAAMIDHSLAVHTGEQRYGSSLRLSGRTLVPAPIKDAAGVDARRAAVGLDPLAVYIQEVAASLPLRLTPAGLAKAVKLHPVCQDYTSEQVLNRVLSSTEIDRLDDRAAALVIPDQAARMGGGDPQSMQKADATSTAWLIQVLRTFGWPSANRTDSQLAFNAWLLTQHADRTPKLQHCVLDLITQQMSTLQERQNFAYLTDRVRLADNQPQVYGTQVSVDEVQNKASPRLLADPANVDRRRATMGLQPLAEYLKLFSKPRP